MCGLAGILLPSKGRIPADLLQTFSQRLAHRGPDDTGYLGWDGTNSTTRTENADEVDGCRLGLVHRRLSILDLSKAGAQPMTSDDGAYHLIFNGEVYNFVELREELLRLNHQFHSTSDTEVVLHAYMQWGTGAFERFIGMFAVAILDLHKRCLVLVRDFFGIKPLYYAFTNGGLAFASEPIPLIELPSVSRRVNPDRLYQYLRFGVTDYGNQTLWQSIQQLPPAHFLEVPLDSPQAGVMRRYWRTTFDAPIDITFEEAASRVRELFLESVRLHLRSDVPIGFCLSGGTDSSSIAMAVRHIVGDGPELHAFSYISSDPRTDETRWIDLVAKEAKLIVHKTQSDSSSFMAQNSERLCHLQGEPFTSTSMIAQHEVFKLAHEAGIKVVLDGQGADEMLGGYLAFLPSRAAGMLSRGRVVEGIQFLMKACRMPGNRWQNTVAGTLALMIPTAFRSTAMGLIGKDLVPEWMNRTWFRNCTNGSSDRSNGCTGRLLRNQLFDAFESSILPRLLRYEDRNSMAFSIESRVPFLTPPLVNFIYSLPEEYLIDSDCVSKSVFRAAMRGLVPDEILDRRNKIGFETPESTWMLEQREMVAQFLDSDVAHSIPALNGESIRRCSASLMSGKVPRGVPLWRWINLIQWTSSFNATFES